VLTASLGVFIVAGGDSEKSTDSGVAGEAGGQSPGSDVAQAP
jgi:hypothetical protein